MSSILSIARILFGLSVQLYLLKDKQLSYFSTNFFFKSFHQFIHNFIYLLIFQSLLFVLQQKTYCIGFLSLLDFITLVNVEQGNIFQEFLFCLVCKFIYFLEFNVFIN